MSEMSETILPTIHRTILATAVIALLLVLALTQQCSCATSGKVVDFGDKLPGYIKENPQKGWLIKFYTAWCHNCQQIELTYIEVAERIYHAHDHLIVGQVNCDKYDGICRQFNVAGVPTILYLRGDRQSKYVGRRDANSIMGFAERMNGPDVNVITDCSQIIPEVERRGLIIIHSTNNAQPAANKEVYATFTLIAGQLKRDYWFYRLFNKTCKIPSDSNEDGVYILKRSLRRWIKFDRADDENIEANMREFILTESFPVFGPLTGQMMNSTKQLAVAVLDEYAPARKFEFLSNKFYKVFEQVAISESQNDDQILFAWSTDLHAIRKIVLSDVRTPNVILLKSDLSHNLLIKSTDNLENTLEQEQQLPDTLDVENVLQYIRAARRGDLQFIGGDTYFYRSARYIYSYIILVKDRYRANPVLTSLMLISMTTTTIVLLYKTKTYLRDDEENIGPQNMMPQVNHKKQD